MDFWDEKIAKVPIIEMEAIIRLQYPGLEGLQYLDDDRMFTWTYQGLCGSLSLESPDGWFVLAVWRYFERGYK
jgi:hypothetical protein